jgi:hypothetical protein
VKIPPAPATKLPALRIEPLRSKGVFVDWYMWQPDNSKPRARVWVHLPGRTISLTPREFKLLCHALLTEPQERLLPFEDEG